MRRRAAYAEIFGLDRSGSLLAVAEKEVTKGRGITLVEGDARETDFPSGHFDAVRVDRSLQHVERPEEVIAEMARILKRGGRAVVCEPDWDTFRVTSSHEEEFGKAAAFWRDSFVNPRAGWRAAGQVGQEVAEPLPKGPRIALSRLMRFCSAAGVAPDVVDDGVLDRFLAALERESLVRDPRAAHRGAIAAWNRAAGIVPGWPAIVLAKPPSRRRPPYVLKVARFPASFRADLAGWLDRLAGGADPLGDLPFRPVRPGTLERRRLQVLQLASALVHRGREPGELRSLADLARPENLREALRFFLERAPGDRSTRQIHALATTALAIARHWVRVDDAQEQALRGLARRCDPGPGGTTEKNRAVLRRLEDERRVRELLALPDRLARGLARKPALTRAEALRLQTALAVGILIAAPVRVSNLAALEVDRHLLRLGHGAERRVHLRLPAAEVKNGQELEHALPGWVTALLELYLARARPVLRPRPGPWLFPGRGEGPKTRHTLGKQISDATERALGVRLTPHQFRHACGAVYLGANPGGHEVVRHLLGHRSIATTIRFYAGLETAAALRHYDRAILGLRQDPPAGGGTP